MDDSNMDWLFKDPEWNKEADKYAEKIMELIGDRQFVFTSEVMQHFPCLEDKKENIEQLIAISFGFMKLQDNRKIKNWYFMKDKNNNLIPGFWDDIEKLPLKYNNQPTYEVSFLEKL